MKLTDWRRVVANVLIAAGLWMAGPLAERGGAAELGVNLVENGDFESVDPGATGGSLGAKQILGWSTTTGGLFAYSHDGSAATPDYANGGPLADGGSYYFTPNASEPDIVAPGQAYQLIDLSSGEVGNVVADGRARFSLSGIFSGYQQDGDRGNLQVDFLDGSGAALVSARVSDADPSAWTPQRIVGGIPREAQSARVSIFGEANRGGPDGYIDNVGFQVTDAHNRQPNTLKVMTFNVWSGENTEAGQQRLAAVIRASDADIVGLQEMGSAAGQAIADQLGFHFHQQSGGGIQIISRYPIVDQSAGNRGAEIELAPGRSVWLFNAHLAAYPYQPYDLRDGTLPMEEAAVVAAADAARGGQVTSYLDEMQAALASGLPLFLTGDFNEPSHLDWTEAAAEATERPFDLKVEYPTSKRIADAGLIDSLREVRPDEVHDRAETWTPGYPPPNLNAGEVHDRIDLVYHRGSGVEVTDAYLLGIDIDHPSTDIAVAGYNSDHRAVVVTYQVPDDCFLLGDMNGDCALDATDWALFRSHQHADLTGFSPAEAYARGDLNGDLQNNHADFILFKQTFERANGAGAFAAMLIAVPEPRTVVLQGAGAALIVLRRLFFQR